MPQHYSTVVGERTTADIRATNIAERNKSLTAKKRDITNTNREQGKTLLTRRNQRRVLVGIKNASGMFIKHTFDSETGLAKKGAGYQTLTSGGGKGQMTKNISQRLKDILL